MSVNYVETVSQMVGIDIVQNRARLPAGKYKVENAPAYLIITDHYGNRYIVNENEFKKATIKASNNDLAIPR